MNIRLNLYAVVLLFAFVQGVFYSILFIRRGVSEERVSDFWMAGLVFSLCIFNLGWMLGFMGIHLLGEQLWFFPQRVGLLFGPVVYYYLRTQINAEYQFTRRDFRHFIPYSIYFIYHLSIFLTGKSSVDGWVTHIHGRFHIGDIESIVEVVSSCVYFFLSLRLYKRYQKWLPKERSDVEGIKFDWYKRFLWAVAIGIFSALLFYILGAYIQLSFQEIWIQRAIVGVIICYIAFAGYDQLQPRYLVFNDQQSTTNESAILPLIKIATSDQQPTTNELAVSSNTKIEKEELEKWKIRIDEAMTKEQLFLNPELTLSELSERLKSHNSLVSYIINTAFEKNFNDFVNAYRVESFRGKINDPKLKHLTLLAIAFDCGFNSKSTFNRAIKKETGGTPKALMIND
jgi:AraC-like DNA-binding protein